MPKALLVNIRAFRADMTRFLKEAREKGLPIVLMRHTEPVARIIPFDRGTELEEVVGKSLVRKGVKSRTLSVHVAKKHPRKAVSGRWRRMFGL